MINIENLFEAHLNVSWLRPANVVWDTMASWWVRHTPFRNPVLDLGSGNGIFSFLTAGGEFSSDFDWFVNVDTERSSSDMYNVQPKRRGLTSSIVKKPEYRIDIALDRKANLLSQAALLGLYDQTVCRDANARTPFAKNTFNTIFCNILYWLRDPVGFLKECRRILQPDGQVILCMPDPLFYAYCESYRFKDLKSNYLRLLNGKRANCIRWTMNVAQMKGLARRTGFQVVRHHGYLTRRTLTLWDTELRATTRPIAKALNGCGLEKRAAIKREFVTGVRPVLRSLLEEERRSEKNNGFHVFVLARIGHDL